MRKKKKQTPTPKWMKEVIIIYERPKKHKATKNTSTRSSKEIKPQKSSPKIETEFIMARCSCGGERESCFRCDGAGFYRKEIVTNMDECQDRIERRQTYNTTSVQENQFSNDQRGGIFGIRENGRFSSNPHYEEDL